MIISKSVGVHDGSFHADEISACALLVHFGLIERSKVFRSRNHEILKTCEFVCDTEGDRYCGCVTIKV